VATQITIPIGPPGQQGEPGPASTVPGPPGPAGEDGFGIQLIGTVVDSASLDPAYTGNVGDVFVADDTRNGFAWDGSVWINVGQIKGDNGLSAYQVWLANGNSGTEADFLLSLRGQDGAPGQAGPTQDLLAFIATKNNAGFVTPETYTTLTGWDEDETNSAYSFNATTGELTFDSSGLYFVIVDLFPDPTVGNNRVQLKGKIQEDKGSGFQDVPSLEWGNYSARNGQQDEGGLSAPFLRRYDVGDVIRIQVERTGSDADFGEDRARLYVARMEALADGLDGLSAYEIWLNEGNTGTEADFLTSLEGTNGSKWYVGSGIPSAGLGDDGDFYLQTDPTGPGDVYEKQSGSWVFQYTLELNGVGPAGDDGNEWTVSNSVPSVGETVGDLHLQTADDSPGVAGDIWRYNGTTWVIVHNIQGTPGAQGERGATWTISTTSPAFVANVNDLHLQTEDDGSGDKGDIWKYNGTVWQPAGNIAGQDAVAWPDGTTFGTTSNTTFTVASGSVYNLSNSGSSQLTVNFNGVNLIDGQSIVINCTKSGTGNILLASTGEGITYEGSTAALYTTSGTKTFIAVKAAGRLYITSSTFLD
ncbi:collagen-like protein, partial [Lewinella sp. W8]|uniref:collagen-like triple helix repeat-containing protein n=1 Tax=Lewinella sp. W8 TaxID=2528208 RepID=UPI0015647D3E